MFSWGLESSRSVHGDERGMLRITLGSVSGLNAMPRLGRAARGGWAQGLRSGHAQAYTTPPGPSGLVVARPPGRRLDEGKGMKVV